MRRLAAILLLLLAAPAQAAHVRVVTTHGADEISVGSTTTRTLRFVAAPGERNRVRIVQPTPARVVIADDGATLRAAKGCTSRGAHTAVCRLPVASGLRRLDLELGDRSDRVSPQGSVLDMAVAAGPGDDDIITAFGSDRVSGGPGDDRIAGGEQSDRLFGGAGDDVLIGALGDDILVDGPGHDRLRGGARRGRAREH